MTRMMHIYKLEGRYIMYPVCLSDGLWIGRPPGLILDAGTKPVELGSAVQKTLEQSKIIPRIEPKEAV